MIDICKYTGCHQKVPGVYQLVNEEVSVSKLKDVEIEDLLGRDPIRMDIEEILGYVENQVVLVTGGGGSIGSELCRQLAAHRVKELIIFEMYENNAYDIQQELKYKYPDLKLTVLIGSVRNSNRLEDVFKITDRISCTMRLRISMCRSWRTARMRQLKIMSSVHIRQQCAQISIRQSVLCLFQQTRQSIHNKHYGCKQTSL